MTKSIKLIQAGTLPEPTARALHAEFDVVETSGKAADIAKVARAYGAAIRGMTVRQAHVDATILDLMPSLEIISSYSAGLDGIDVDAARARGIKIANTSHVLAEDVADLTLALMLASLRGTVRGHEFVTARRWAAGSMPLQQSPRGMRAGIVGLGHIGSAVARRLDAMHVTWGYSGPNAKATPAPYFADVGALADWAQILIVTCPATPATIGMINADVLSRLGPQGHLINVARGTIVDEAAVINALASDVIAGAALDVFASEPNVPAALLNDPRIVLSPHMGSGTSQTRMDMGTATLRALRDHFAPPA